MLVECAVAAFGPFKLHIDITANGNAFAHFFDVGFVVNAAGQSWARFFGLKRWGKNKNETEKKEISRTIHHCYLSICPLPLTSLVKSIIMEASHFGWL